MSIGKIIGTAAGCLAVTAAVTGIGARQYEGMKFERTPMPLAQVSEELAGADVNHDEHLNLRETEELFKTVIDQDKNGFLSASDRLKLINLQRELSAHDYFMEGYFPPNLFFKRNLREAQHNLNTVKNAYDEVEGIKVGKLIEALRD